MLLIVDECVPQSLATHFSGHDVHTVRSMGWAGKKNGELMTLIAGANFEALVTVDQNLPYQQNVPALVFGIVVLAAKSNKVADLLPLVPKALIALQTLQPGTCVAVS
jgi:PIN like domain